MNNKSVCSRILMIVLLLFITGIIVMNFFFVEPKYNITFEIVICLLIMTVLVLSETFDSLCIPKFLSLTKNVKEIKNENRDLKEANVRLLEQITNIKNSNSQNIYLPNSFSVTSSTTIDDVEKDKECIPSDDSDEVTNHGKKNDMAEFETRFKYRRYMSVFILKKALNSDSKLGSSNVRYDVKLSSNKSIEDNIMKNETCFDALEITDNAEIFYETTHYSLVPPIYEIYYKLRMLELYNDSSNKKCKLVLLIPKYGTDLNEIMLLRGENRMELYIKSLTEKFESAINNGLFEIRKVDVTKKELDKYIEERKNGVG